MNYLAHIHLAHITNTSLLGNFLGDFVKGSDLGYLSPELSRGVRLHRAIDTFTDQHVLVRQLKKQFPSSIRRMSGVTIDIYFDHLLSLYWCKYNANTIHYVLDKFYAELTNNDISLAGRFSEVKQGLLTYQWLHEYAQKEAVNRAFFQIEKRLNHRVRFAQESIDFIANNEQQFSVAFTQFYPALIDYCQSQG
ncbi:MAG: acyl carrier protein phosphodiesterase [Kangiellaceae bacterium]|jgi:acyl carrier protein phosphodiesterase